jgi:hypothetical protein
MMRSPRLRIGYGLRQRRAHLRRGGDEDGVGGAGPSCRTSS